MRLYLSSFRMGNHPEHLAALVGGDGRNVVVIANALDDAPADVRRSGLERELAALADLGFDGVELDLRNYFGQEQRLRRDLAGAALAWLRGGNVCMLRYALFRSAGDVVFRKACLRQTRWSTPDTAQDRVPCPRVCGALRLSTMPRGHADLRFRAGVGWPGGAQEAFLPHYQSPGHPETAAMDLVVARYQAEGVSYRPLRDGQALLINGPDTKIV